MSHCWFPTTSCFGVTNHGEAASLWLVRQDRATINLGSDRWLHHPRWVGWLVRYLDIYLFYVYERYRDRQGWDLSPQTSEWVASDITHSGGTRPSWMTMTVSRWRSVSITRFKSTSNTSTYQYTETQTLCLSDPDTETQTDSRGWLDKWVRISDKCVAR